MSEYEYKILTPAERAKLRRIFAADPRFQPRRHKQALVDTSLSLDKEVKPPTDPVMRKNNKI